MKPEHLYSSRNRYTVPQKYSFYKERVYARYIIPLVKFTIFIVIEVFIKNRSEAKI